MLVSINDIFKTDWKQLENISYCIKEFMQSILCSYIVSAFGRKSISGLLPKVEPRSKDDEITIN